MLVTAHYLQLGGNIQETPTRGKGYGEDKGAGSTPGKVPDKGCMQSKSCQNCTACPECNNCRKPLSACTKCPVFWRCPEQQAGYKERNKKRRVK
jgi:hypothetical protein